MISNRVGVGVGGAVAYTYLNQRPGDGHYIAIACKALLTKSAKFAKIIVEAGAVEQ